MQQTEGDMKEKYEVPLVTVITFSTDDVITASNGTLLDWVIIEEEESRSNRY